MSRGGDRDFVKMSFRAVEVVDDQGRVDLDAFDKLVELALRDGIFDDAERRVLRTVISMVDPDGISPELKERIDKLREQHGI